MHAILGLSGGGGGLFFDFRRSVTTIPLLLSVPCFPMAAVAHSSGSLSSGNDEYKSSSAVSYSSSSSFAMKSFKLPPLDVSDSEVVELFLVVAVVVDLDI